LVHGNEIKGAVESTGEVAHINVKSKLLVLELEHLVTVIILHEIDTGTDILGVWAVGDESKWNGISTVRVE
jgi:hypothetical protein